MRSALLRRPAPAAQSDRAWQRAQHATRRWALWGAATGVLLGVLLFLPASWLAERVQQATGERLLLADVRGSVWNGSAVLLLTGGPGSRDASALPGRLRWRLRPAWRGLRITAEQACCLNGKLHLQLQPTLSGFTLVLPARPQAIGQWPTRWLEGLGAPWNTLQLGGTLQLSSPGLTIEQVAGRTRLTGTLELQAQSLSSRLSTLDSLGSYRLALRSDAAAGDAVQVSLQTLEGALRLSGSGQWTGARLRFRGQAQAAEGQESGLVNLLNIIGRRQGASAVISIG
ncbi:type II secretion system protein N [Aquabacterium sp.]|uniref:type II secretion system protein N n=1 Tax=Aquabacterium sp. TaxID=1872578 RepID=UPI002C668247|nr:type II secretion system protein N [Aquabacterium sp.]HSW07121.1 type II secretion system protein N [Aquabacterium sp.]